MKKKKLRVYKPYWHKEEAGIRGGSQSRWRHPLQCSCLENPVDGGAWWAAVHGVAESRTRLSDFTFTFRFHALEEMATHSCVLAWRIPGTGEPGGLLSVGSYRVGHDWSDLAAAAAAAGKRYYTLAFSIPGEFFNIEMESCITIKYKNFNIILNREDMT